MNNKIVIGGAQGSRPKAQGISIGFIGAGSYAQSHLLPNIPFNGKVRLTGVMTAGGTGSRSVGERFGFEFCTSEEKDILENKEIDTIFIATRHDSHASYVLKSLRAGKHVFVEKPLCLTPEELDEISDLYHSLLSAPCSMPSLMVGYNRRFSPLATEIKQALGNGPMAMIYRVNAGAIPPESWIQDAETGGGRIIGEVCHFVDFLTFMNGSLPVRVHAAAMKDVRNLQDVVNISLAYENGSIGTISYLANGDKRLSKERVEIFANGCTAVLDDFKSLTLYAGGKKKSKNFFSQDKGQKTEVKAFLDSIQNGKRLPIPFEELHSASLVTFKVLESLHTGQAIPI